MATKKKIQAQDEDTRSHGEKIRDSLIKKYGENYYSGLGKVGGKRSKNRPFRDRPGAAKKAIDARWKKYRETHPATA